MFYIEFRQPVFRGIFIYQPVPRIHNFRISKEWEVGYAPISQ